MKGVSVLVAAVLVIAISIAAITIALNVGNPAIAKSKEVLLFNEGKENLLIIDNAINQVLQEGDGSSRKISLQVADGKYTIGNGYIEFVMDTPNQIIGEDVSRTEDILEIEEYEGEIYVWVDYDFDFVEEKILYSGTHQLIISNQGGDIAVS